ncbi:DUF6952 family protein [Hugenholtzia roseola]|uniref:DUF6952 family protein n=1 Tax=Hugenholtzia roseola TaxID=1002 RepID=UPI00041FAE10|nr:hypothetical protein [Hugenholtzia roseola]
MKLPIIKKLAESYEVAQLEAAAEALEAGEQPAIEIEGADEGEQLTHALAAAWVRQKVETDGVEAREALRAYTQMVRNSIS